MIKIIKILSIIFLGVFGAMYGYCGEYVKASLHVWLLTCYLLQDTTEKLVNTQKNYIKTLESRIEHLLRGANERGK